MNADDFEHLFALGVGLGFADVFVREHDVDQLVADGDDRVERVHGALEHHGGFVPAELAQLGVVHFQDVAAFEEDFAVADQRRGVVQVGDGERQGAFAAAGFAGQADGLTGVDVQGDVVDGTGVAVVGDVVDTDVFNLQQWLFRDIHALAPLRLASTSAFMRRQILM